MLKSVNEYRPSQRTTVNGVTHFAGIESRGFIFAAPLAKLLNAGLINRQKALETPSRNHTSLNTGQIHLKSIKMHVAPMTSCYS